MVMMTSHTSLWADQNENRSIARQNIAGSGFPNLAVFLADNELPIADASGWDKIRQSANDPLVKIDHALAVANHRLSIEAEPSLSRIVLHIESSDDRRNAMKVVADVRSRLNDIEPLIRADDEHIDDEHIDADQIQQRFLKWEQLDAFSRAIENCLAPTLDKEQAEKSVSALSILLEDERNDVSAAASYWQVLLLTKIGAHEHALRRLEVTTAPPRRSAIRWDFLRRCLRAQILLEQEQYEVADAALMVLEEKARPWFNNEPDKDLATRTAAWFRYRALKNWNEVAIGEQDNETATWTANAAGRLIDQMFDDDDNATIFRLYETVPLIATIDDAKP